MAKIYPTLDGGDCAVDFGEKGCGKCLDRSCNDIFIKTPSLTKEILGRMHHEIESKRSYILGYKVNTRQFWVLAGLIIVFLTSFTGTAIMFCTSLFDDAVYSNIILRNNTDFYDMWRKPTVKPLVKFYIFNYTNVEAYRRGRDKKLKIQELGPYVYEEKLERVNVKFQDHLVRYQEKREYEFKPKESGINRQSDKIIVPNLLLFAAAAQTRYTNYFTRWALSNSISNTVPAFMETIAHNFITGYEDDMYNLAKSIMSFNNEESTDTIGLLATKIGLQKDVLEVDTGLRNIDKIGKYVSFNGEQHLNHWSTEECDSLRDSTPGLIYPPASIMNKEPVKLYQKEMCRTVPMVFQRESSLFGGRIPSYRYKIPDNVFDSAEKRGEQQCYCDLDTGTCPMQGVFNTTPCSYGAPTFISFPHFYNADPLILENLDGLDPENAPHESFVEIHPTMGFAMAGTSRFQVNVMVYKEPGMAQVQMFKNGMILPIAWIEADLNEERLPEDVVENIFQATYTVKTIKLTLKYGSLFTALITLLSAIVLVRNGYMRRKNRENITSFVTVN